MHAGLLLLVAMLVVSDQQLIWYELLNLPIR